MENASATRTRESTTFHRRVELPGVEVLDVQDSQRVWRCVSYGFEWMVPETWQGDIAYRGARQRLGSGMLFCPGPGDSFELGRAAEPGAFRVLMIDADALRRGIAERGISPERLGFPGVVSGVPGALSRALVRLLDDVRFAPSPLKLQSSLEELEAALASQLGGSRREATLTADGRVAGRIRELLHTDIERKLSTDAESELDLETLARETGLSRFQVVRTFKRAYDLPPYAYQLRLRIARAQRLLSAGHAPADVASELRFVDQSHLTRHFKRIVGVTPSAYARAKH